MLASSSVGRALPTVTCLDTFYGASYKSSRNIERGFEHPRGVTLMTPKSTCIKEESCNGKRWPSGESFVSQTRWFESASHHAF